MEQQQLICPECGVIFWYDSKDTTTNSIDGDFELPKKHSILTITIYLECPNWHCHPYKVKKAY